MKIPNRMAAHGDFAQEQHAAYSKANLVNTPRNLKWASLDSRVIATSKKHSHLKGSIYDMATFSSIQ
jgi:hypothetical protein